MRPPRAAPTAGPWILSGCLTLALLAPDLPAQKGEAKQASPVSVEMVLVEPPSPGPEKLCKLRVRLKNSGDRGVSSLRFQVKINGQELGLYKNQVFMYVLDPRSTLEVQLYNFWSTESGRAAPQDGTLTVDVALVEAHYYSRGTVEQLVPGLPTSATTRNPFVAR